MKRSLCILAVFMLVAIGCSKPEPKSAVTPEKKLAGTPEKAPVGGTEKVLVGKWTNPSLKGFVAEFNSDRSGRTVTPPPPAPPSPHAAATSKEPAVIPFKWSIEADGRIKITEGKTAYFGKIVDKKLEVEVGGAKTVLVKAD